MNRQILRDYLLITVGVVLLSYAVIAFWQPFGMVTGGVSGLAIIIAHYTADTGFQVPIWLTTLVLNIPLFLIGYRIIPRKYFIRSIYAYLCMVLVLFVVELMPVPELDVLLASLAGGVIAGLGVGLVLRAMATTGGSTLAADIIKRKFLRHMPVGKIIFAVDAVIISTGFVAFGSISTMYAVIAVFVCARITDTILEGLSFSKAAFIISKEADTIASTILKEMNRGCTALDSRGMFTKNTQSMLICVVSAKEIVNLKQVVYSLDERAFVIVTDVREVLGEGFKQGLEGV